MGGCAGPIMAGRGFLFFLCLRMVRKTELPSSEPICSIDVKEGSGYRSAWMFSQLISELTLFRGSGWPSGMRILEPRVLVRAESCFL